MKTSKVLVAGLLVLLGSIPTPSVQAGSRHGGNAAPAAAAAAAPARGSGGHAIRSGAGGYRYGGQMISRGSSAYYRSAMSGQRRFSPGPVTGTYNPARFANARTRSFATVRSNQFNSGNNHFNSNRNGTLNRNGNRAGVGNRSNQGNRVGNARNNHVFARHSANSHPNWDRHHDHFWNGHRCRFINGSWVIFNLGFYPGFGYPYYDYYPYDSYYSDPYAYGYGYGDGSGYEYGPSDAYQGDAAPYDDKQGPYDNSYNNQNQDGTVADIQQRLARQGYYHGQIDGVLGPDTQRALESYQRRNNLRVTGSATPETLQSLGRR